MLQQTRAVVVVPYFKRWMKLFPTVQALSKASSDRVIKEWEGLGYYSRARNLHRGAQMVMEQFGGVLPADYYTLRQIPGIGDYTANAILAFAFRHRAAAVDGNVLRVACRYFGILEDITKLATQTSVRTQVETWLPQERPWEITEALIELGATLCGRVARCAECPLQEGCYAHAHGTVTTLPVRSKKVTVQQLRRVVAVVVANGYVLVKRGEAGKVMADLYEFPYFESEGEWPAFRVIDQLGLAVTPVKALSEVEHRFTRFRARLYPWLLKAEKRFELPGHLWVQKGALESLAFSSGHRKIVRLIDFAEF